MATEFSRQILEKSSNIKFHENPSSEGRAVPCGGTDRYDEANSRCSSFCQRAQKIYTSNRHNALQQQDSPQEFLRTSKEKLKTCKPTAICTNLRKVHLFVFGVGSCFASSI